MNGQRTDVIQENTVNKGCWGIDCKLYRQHTHSLFNGTLFHMWEISTRGENPETMSIDGDLYISNSQWTKMFQRKEQRDALKYRDRWHT